MIIATMSLNVLPTMLLMVSIVVFFAVWQGSDVLEVVISDP